MQGIQRRFQALAICGLALGLPPRRFFAGDAAFLRFLFELVEQSHRISPITGGDT